MSTPAASLSFKPNLQEAAERWEAYLGGELIDRPLVCVSAPIPDRPSAPGAGYRDRVFGDLDLIIDNALINAAATYYGGEAMPTFMLSFGCDEAAVFCGAELRWSEASADTNWSVPFIEDWDCDLPLMLDDDHPLWRRLIEFYHRAGERLAGHMLLSSFDTHTNMDLLAAARGPERLCLDLMDCPEMIDRAMADAREIFHRMWRRLAEAGGMDRHGYCNGLYSMTGAAILQCDFSCMVSPSMFRRWARPRNSSRCTAIWIRPGSCTAPAVAVPTKRSSCSIGSSPTPDSCPPAQPGALSRHTGTGIGTTWHEPDIWHLIA